MINIKYHHKYGLSDVVRKMTLNKAMRFTQQRSYWTKQLNTITPYLLRKANEEV
jgi:hypothetical protein